MLVLTRKLQEQIRIGDNVTITVLRVKGQAVRIGIEAPREVRVVRAELPRNGEQAAAGPPESSAAETNPSAAPAASPGDDAESSSPSADEQPPSATTRRLPQRRMMNRYGSPPLRLACSHVLAGSATT